MCQAEGFVDEDKPRHVFHLHKSFYSLIQASRVCGANFLTISLSPSK